MRWENQALLLHLGQLSQLVVDLGVVEDAAELLRADAQRIDVDHRASVGIGGVWSMPDLWLMVWQMAMLKGM